MLISYPVLPARQANESEDAYLERLMAAHIDPNEGQYPVSTLNTSHGPMHRWHGGTHIVGNGEPIRAIADGLVVAFRFAQVPENYEGLGRYDTSFVLIRHTTETGEHTNVEFYSLYMHLASRSVLLPDRYQQLSPWLKQATPGPGVQRPSNLRVWRKDVLGFAGTLYDREACHIEVFATDAALGRFWRDSTATTQGAGSADFFGDAHFVIPANQAFAVRHPRAAVTGAHRIDLPGNNDFALPEGTAGQNTETLHVSVRLEQGRRIATTFVAKPDGSYSQLGDPVRQDNYEYELYRLATAMYPDCPSAGFEWLRFGRVLGSDTTTRVENWQLVRYSATAMGFVDLAPNAIAKLSDADFVRWQGWEKRDEGQTANAGDGICDDQRTIELCQGGDDAARAKVRHLVCRAPSEWDASDLEARYGHLREPGQPLAEADAWQKFVAHVQKMAFWAEAGLGDRSIWHFHPMQFVRHFRKCGWLSSNELARCIPRHSISAPTLSWDTAISRARTHAPFLNIYFRKYKGESRERHAHALAQIYIETGLLRTVSEDGGGIGLAYGAFYGRGYNQLTWASNYETYGIYKGIASQVVPSYVDTRVTATSTHAKDQTGQLIQWAPRYDPQIVESDLGHAAEASGLYWVSKSFRGRKNMNRVCDIPFSPSSVGFNCWLINGGGNGYANRQQFAKFLADVLFDLPPQSGVVQFRYPPLNPPGNPALCQSFPPQEVAYTSTGTVNHEKQIP
jgi:hypothetical protein